MTAPAAARRPAREDAWRSAPVAAEYDARRFRTPLQRRKHRRDEALVLALLRAAGAGPRLLDLPCGTGRLVPCLARAGYRVCGADLSSEMLRERPWRLGASDGVLGLIQASADRLPFRDASFDAVVSMRFLFHIESRERRVAILAELARTAPLVVGQVRYRATAKHLGRFLRSRVGLARRYRPSNDRATIERELADAGLELVALRPVSLLFSDKALFVARRVARAR